MSQAFDHFDSVREILEVALSVLEDYSDEHSSRIARMARWLVLNIGADLDDRQLGPCSRVATDDNAVYALQLGSRVRVQAHGSLSGEHARQLAIALLMCAERSDHYRTE